MLVARVPGAGSARTDRSEARWLLGVEVLQRDTVHTSDGRRVLGRALRVRDGWRPLASGAAISDLLLLRRSPGPTPSLEAALDSAAGSRTVRRGAQGAIYWEQYDVASSTTSAPAGVGSAGANVAPDTIVIAATRLTQSLRGRLAGALRLGSAERPIALRFPDPAAGGAVVGHAIALTWPDVPPGEYQLDVTRVPGSAGRQSATSSLVVQITDN